MRLLDGHAHEAMIAADVVLLASGTAALEAMLAKRPMVVGYRISVLTYRMVMGLGLMKVNRFSLPNVLANEPIVTGTDAGRLHGGEPRRRAAADGSTDPEVASHAGAALPGASTSACAAMPPTAPPRRSPNCWRRTMKRAGELVAGVDEAGRGPLAGPVVCAAVILNPRRRMSGLADSKVLSEQEREALFPMIQQRCLAWQVVFVEREEIDTLNILWATMDGMRRAVCAMVPAATRVLIDGDRVPPGLPCPATALVKRRCARAGDHGRVDPGQGQPRPAHGRAAPAIPGYGFDRNKGYATREHFASLARLGPCAEHRRSFAPVRDCQLPLFLPDALPVPMPV